jgi:hypothetical protein
MENWGRELSEMMQEIADGVEQFLAEVGKEVDEMVDAFVDASEEFTNQVQATIAPDLEQRLNEFFDPILEAYLGFEISFEESVEPLVNQVEQSVEPMLNNHPACVGCRHYHGQSYNGVMFVCGMHPYGCEEEKCPDWESFWGEEK